MAAAPGGPPELLALDPANNGPGAPYRVRCPPARAVEGGGLGQAAGRALAWRSTPALLRCALLAGGTLPRASATAAASAAASPDPVSTAGPDPIAALAGAVDWGWADAVAGAAGWGPPLAASLLAGGAGGAVAPASWDPVRPRLLACLGGGTARLLTTTPGDALARAYPFPAAHPHAGQSAVRWADPDLGAWPAFAGLRCSSATLRPGDVAVIPPGAMVHAELVPTEEGGGMTADGCVLLILHLAPSPCPSPLSSSSPPLLSLTRPPAADRGALAVRAVLGAEAILAAAVGVEQVRAWLAAVATGAAPPRTSAAAAAGTGLPTPLGLGSVRGAAVAAACGRAARLLATAAGGSAAGGAALAAVAVTRRLVPTPWCDDPAAPSPDAPLLAADAAAGWPLRFALDLTEEEAAYPELFRRSLAAKRAPEARGRALPPPRGGWGRLGLGWEGGAGLPALPAPTAADEEQQQ